MLPILVYFTFIYLFGGKHSVYVTVRPVFNIFYIYLFCGWEKTLCHSVHVEVRRQLGGTSSPLF